MQQRQERHLTLRRERRLRLVHEIKQLGVAAEAVGEKSEEAFAVAHAVDVAFTGQRRVAFLSIYRVDGMGNGEEAFRAKEEATGDARPPGKAHRPRQRLRRARAVLRQAGEGAVVAAAAFGAKAA